MDLHKIEKSGDDRDDLVGGNVGEDERLGNLIENVERQRDENPELHCRMLLKVLESRRVCCLACLDGSFGDDIGTAHTKRGMNRIATDVLSVSPASVAARVRRSGYLD